MTFPEDTRADLHLATWQPPSDGAVKEGSSAALTGFMRRQKVLYMALSRTGMVGLAFFVTGLGWSGLASFLSNRAGLERAGLGWQVLTKTGLQGFSLA